MLVYHKRTISEASRFEQLLYMSHIRIGGKQLYLMINSTEKALRHNCSKQSFSLYRDSLQLPVGTLS